MGWGLLTRMALVMLLVVASRACEGEACRAWPHGGGDLQAVRALAHALPGIYHRQSLGGSPGSSDLALEVSPRSKMRLHRAHRDGVHRRSLGSVGDNVCGLIVDGVHCQGKVEVGEGACKQSDAQARPIALGVGGEAEPLACMGKAQRDQRARAPVDLPIGFALGIAVASRGADHLRNRPTLEVFKLPDEVRAKIYGRANDPDPTGYKDKGLIIAWGDDIFAVTDSLGICKFVTRGFNSPHLLGYEEFCELIAASTGLEYTPETLRAVGRRVLDTERLINADFGLTRADDTLPKRYFDEPMPARQTKGHHIDRSQFQNMLDEYYMERGWDRDGRVSAERIAEIDDLTTVIARSER